MSLQNKLGFFLILISLFVLYPGLTNHVLTIQIAPTLPLVGKLELFKETRSIIGTIQNLYNNGNILVSALILVFSVLVPFLKAVLLLISLFSKNLALNFKLFTFVKAIGKWSMADVFIVGVFVAFLSTGSMQGINAFIEPGFYYFIAYCLISLFAIQFIKIEKPS